MKTKDEAAAVSSKPTKKKPRRSKADSREGKTKRAKARSSTTPKRKARRGHAKVASKAASQATDASRGSDTPRQSRATDTFVIVRVGSARLAFPASATEEVHEVSVSTPVPRVPSYIPGIMGLRGDAVPLLDLGSFLMIQRESESPKGQDASLNTGRVVVVKEGSMRVGLVCDRVLGLIDLAQSELRPLTVTQLDALQEYALGEWHLSDGPAVVLNLSMLLESARVTG